MDSLQPALLRIGRDSVELREGTDPPGRAGFYDKIIIRQASTNGWANPRSIR
jgi:hypothetical protein